MVVSRLFRLRRLQRWTKVSVVILSASFFSYLLYVFSKETGNGVSSLVNLTTGRGQEKSPKTLLVGLNNHIWRGVCSAEVWFLKKWPAFPTYPDEARIITEFQAEDSGIDYGQLIFGFIQPPKSDLYRFAIASDDTSELWLSANEDPTLKKKIAQVYSKESSAWTAKGELNKYREQISNHIELRAGNRYYIEAVHKQGTGNGFVEVYWANSDPGSELQLITSKFLSPFQDNSTVLAKKDALHALFSTENRLKEMVQNSTYSKRFLEFYSLPLIAKSDYLPSCPYKTSFVLKTKVNRFNGIHFVRESIVYPEDSTHMGSTGGLWSWPNTVADSGVIKLIVDKVIDALRRNSSKNYVLTRIHKILQKSDPVHGDRFSLDLEVALQEWPNRFYRLSEHVYLHKGTDRLCFPEKINWNKNSTVYFILPVKDQGKWVYHFVNQLSRASLLTGDTNFHVILIDFESQDIDVTKALDTSLLSTRHTYLNLTGKFYKTLALNKGVELVPSPHDIVFLFDLHLDVPVDIMDSVRKNTIEGRIALFPAVGRLECESSAAEHRGFWQLDGYGILAVYKSDWIRFEGMNVEDFKYKWGGEDWDLLDRVLNAELEVERIKYPGLYHHYHNRQKTWS